MERSYVMNELQMGVIESRFADIIWQNEPLSASDLAKHAQKQFNWKKTTSYTVLKRLCDKGIFQNNNGCVTSLITRENFYALQSEKFIDDTFDGSLPAFLAAFTSRKQLSQEEVNYLRRIIASYEED